MPQEIEFSSLFVSKGWSCLISVENQCSSDRHMIMQGVTTWPIATVPRNSFIDCKIPNWWDFFGLRVIPGPVVTQFDLSKVAIHKLFMIHSWFIAWHAENHCMVSMSHAWSWMMFHEIWEKLDFFKNLHQSLSYCKLQITYNSEKRS